MQQISGERLQDHWSSGFFSFFVSAADSRVYPFLSIGHLKGNILKTCGNLKLSDDNPGLSRSQKALLVFPQGGSAVVMFMHVLMTVLLLLHYGNIPMQI